MILEVAILDAKPGENERFQRPFAKARPFPEIEHYELLFSHSL